MMLVPGPLSVGKAEFMIIVHTPPPQVGSVGGILNRMIAPPRTGFADCMAPRSEQPEPFVSHAFVTTTSLVVLTVKVVVVWAKVVSEASKKTPNIAVITDAW